MSYNFKCIWCMYTLQVIVQSWEIKKIKFTTFCMNLDQYNTINRGFNQQACKLASMRLFYFNQDPQFEI